MVVSEGGGAEEGSILTLGGWLLRRETSLMRATYLADLLPAFPGSQPLHCVFLGVEAIRKNMNAALSCRNDKFVSTVVRNA
jgi:hypothetical protein